MAGTVLFEKKPAGRHPPGIGPLLWAREHRSLVTTPRPALSLVRFIPHPAGMHWPPGRHFGGSVQSLCHQPGRAADLHQVLFNQIMAACISARTRISSWRPSGFAILGALLPGCFGRDAARQGGSSPCSLPSRYAVIRANG